MSESEHLAEIGIRLAKGPSGVLLVSRILRGSPAERAGLKGHDAIVEIDSIATKTLTVEKAEELLRGPEGSIVTLNVIGLASRIEGIVDVQRTCLGNDSFMPPSPYLPFISATLPSAVSGIKRSLKDGSPPSPIQSCEEFGMPVIASALHVLSMQESNLQVDNSSQFLDLYSGCAAVTYFYRANNFKQLDKIAKEFYHSAPGCLHAAYIQRQQGAIEPLLSLLIKSGSLSVAEKLLSSELAFLDDRPTDFNRRLLEIYIDIVRGQNRTNDLRALTGQFERTLFRSFSFANEDSLQFLAELWMELNSTGKAIELYESLLSLQFFRGHQHSSHQKWKIVSTYHSLSRAYLRANRVKDSLTAIETALQISNALLSEDERIFAEKSYQCVPPPSKLLETLSEVYIADGQLDEGFEQYSKTIEFIENSLGKSCPQLLGPLNRLLAAYEKAGREKASKGVRNRIEEIEKELAGDSLPSKSEIRSNLLHDFQSAFISENEQISDRKVGQLIERFGDALDTSPAEIASWSATCIEILAILSRHDKTSDALRVVSLIKDKTPLEEYTLGFVLSIEIENVALKEKACGLSSRDWAVLDSLILRLSRSSDEYKKKNRSLRSVNRAMLIWSIARCFFITERHSEARLLLLRGLTYVEADEPTAWIEKLCILADLAVCELGLGGLELAQRTIDLFMVGLPFSNQLILAALSRLADSLVEHGHESYAEEILLKVREAASAVLLKSHLDTINERLANLYETRGDPQKAGDVFALLLEGTHDLYDWLRLLDRLSSNYELQHRWSDALCESKKAFEVNFDRSVFMRFPSLPALRHKENCLRRAVLCAENEFGRESKELLPVLKQLCEYLESIGNFDSALGPKKQALEISKACYGVTSSEYRELLYEIYSSPYEEFRLSTESIRSTEVAASVFEKIDDSRAQDLWMSAATKCMQLNEFDKSKDYFLRAISLAERSSSTISLRLSCSAAHSLVTRFVFFERYIDAFEIVFASLRVNERSKSKAPDILCEIHAVLAYLSLLADKAETVQHHVDTCLDYFNAIPFDKLSTSRFRDSFRYLYLLADELIKRDHAIDGIEVVIAVLEMETYRFGEGSKELLETKKRLSSVYELTKDFERAEHLMQDCIDICTVEFGESSRSVQDYKREKTLLHRNLGKADELDDDSIDFVPEVIDRIRKLLELSTTPLHSERFDVASDLLMQAYKLAVQDAPRPVQCECLQALSQMYQTSKQWDLAEVWMLRKLSLLKDLHGAKSYELARGMREMGRILKKAGRADESDEWSRRADEIIRPDG